MRKLSCLFILTGRNYEKVDKSIFDGVWSYTTSFAGKPVKGQHAELVFDGLNYYADVFLNGRQIASSDTTFGVFIRRKYDVTDLLKDRKVYAVNESAGAAPHKLQATLIVFDAASRLIGEETKPVSIGYRGVVPVFDLKRYDGKPHFVALQLNDSEGPVADNFYCLPAQDNTYEWKRSNWYVTPVSSYADLGFVFGQGPAEVEVSVVQSADGYDVTLTNKSSVISVMNVLKALDGKGDLVVPAFWSDNFFPLLPGQSKTVKCTTDALDVHFEVGG